MYISNQFKNKFNINTNRREEEIGTPLAIFEHNEYLSGANQQD